MVQKSYGNNRGKKNTNLNIMSDLQNVRHKSAEDKDELLLLLLFIFIFYLYSGILAGRLSDRLLNLKLLLIFQTEFIKGKRTMDNFL
jgi:hypothetical protein